MITYFDTSIVMKLLIDDEAFRAGSERLWVESEFAVCAEIGYTEARAALAADTTEQAPHRRRPRTAKTSSSCCGSR